MLNSSKAVLQATQEVLGVRPCRSPCSFEDEILRLRDARDRSGDPTQEEIDKVSEEQSVDFHNGILMTPKRKLQPWQSQVLIWWRIYCKRWQKIDTWVDNLNKELGKPDPTTGERMRLTKAQQRLEYFINEFGQTERLAVPWPIMTTIPRDVNYKDVKIFFQRAIIATKYSVAEPGEKMSMAWEDIEHGREVILREKGRWWDLSGYIERRGLPAISDHFAGFNTATAVQIVLNVLNDLEARFTEPTLVATLESGETLSTDIYDFTEMLEDYEQGLWEFSQT